MLGADKFVLQFRHLLFRAVEHTPEIAAETEIDIAPAHPWQFLQRGAELFLQRICPNTNFLEQRSRDSLCLVEEGEKEMLIRDLLLARFRGDILRSLHRLLHFLRELIDTHVLTYESLSRSQSGACIPRFPESKAPGRALDAALTSDGILLLIIATGVVLACAWVGWHYYESDEDQAHAYARRTVERLAIAHDASYFSSNLSAAALPGYPTSRRRLIMSSLTKLGVPTGPIKLVGSASPDKDPNIPGPIRRFTTNLTYPTATARIFLEVAQWHGHWRIELFALEWKNLTEAEPSP